MPKLALTVYSYSSLSADDLRRILPDINLSGPGILQFMETNVLVTQTLTLNRALRRTLSASEQEANVQPTFGIAFGQGQPFAGESVIPKLFQMVREIERALRLLTHACRQPNRSP